jgi:four helix bundle protein
MSHVRSFRDLDAWQMGMRAVELTYRLTADFPDTERFGLVSQMRRAAVSVPSNLAEAQAVRSTRWSLRLFAIAIASLSELDTQLEVALRLRFVDPGAAGDLLRTLDRLRQILYGLRRDKERRIGLTAVVVACFLLCTVMWLRIVPAADGLRCFEPPTIETRLSVLDSTDILIPSSPQ